MTRGLAKELSRQDWNHARAWFVAQEPLVERAEKAHVRIALWVEQILSVEGENPAAPFIREVQVHSHQVLSLLSLSLLRPAAGEARAMVEAALYYSYFRNHPCELRTLARQTGQQGDWYIDKKGILDHHRCHTSDFAKRAGAVNLLGLLEPWYREVSALAHGQVPGRLGASTSLGDVHLDEAATESALGLFERGGEIVHFLLLVTIAEDLWPSVAPEAQTRLRHGLSSEQRKTLNLR